MGGWEVRYAEVSICAGVRINLKVYTVVCWWKPHSSVRYATVPAGLGIKDTSLSTFH